ncbi:MAG: glycogen synthase GlgA [Candidatus Omnitrophota bacterium]|nr:MAG: glycogen synthase GlgA [Candidatus Omnitrophota bacterium]
MKVAFCSSEVFPFAKTGGLADVSGALPFALAKQGCTVKVFMPFYKNIKPQKMYDEYGYTKEGSIEFYFIRNDSYFMRDALYGTPQGDYPDNLERFSFYSKKVLGLLKKLNFSPDIIHSNDWQASLVNIYLKLHYKEDDFFRNTKSVLTLHNLAYQGIFEKEKYPFLEIPKSYFTMHYLEYYGKINLLKGGIVFSDMVNTVSPTYAKQIQTPDYGCGLDGVLRERRESLCGILNAIDYNVWNPRTDAFLYRNYSAGTLQGKAFNKRKFQKELGLKVNKNSLLLGMVSRLAEQKGVDILSKALGHILKKYQIVILGLGDERYHQILKKKANKFKESFSLHLKFDEVLAHRIYGCCDCFLMPSRFEPCGLSQMISYQYGTIPVVHHTGGLIDTVSDAQKGGGGFVFRRYNPQDLISAVERAEELFRKKDMWLRLVKKVTQYNFSWEATADKYIKMYKKMLNSKSEIRILEQKI